MTTVNKLTKLCMGTITTIALFFGLGVLLAHADYVGTPPEITVVTPAESEISGEITMEIEVEDVDDDLYALQIDISKRNENTNPGDIAYGYSDTPTCGGSAGQRQQLTLYAIPGDPFQADTAALEALNNMGIYATYATGTSSSSSGGVWTLTLDTSVNDSGDYLGCTVGTNLYNGFVPTKQLFPNDKYTFSYIAVDDEGQQSGDWSPDPNGRGSVTQVTHTFRNTPLVEDARFVRGANGNLWLIVDAESDNLMQIEIDNSTNETTVPGVTLNAQEGTAIYQGDDADDFATINGSALYDGDEQLWTIDLGDLTATIEGESTFSAYLELEDNDGKVSGTMGSTDDVSNYYRVDYSYDSETFLQDLTVDGTTVTGFNPATYNYTVEIAKDATDSDVAGMVVDASAFHPGAGVNTGSQATSLSNNVATVKVTSADTESTQYYTVTFERRQAGGHVSSIGGGDFNTNTDEGPTACTKEYEPVCGVDGETYGNDCLAEAAGVAIAYQGKCNVESEEPIICTLEYAPVCGVDGVTYGNDCMADGQGVEIAYIGECEGYNPADAEDDTTSDDNGSQGDSGEQSDAYQWAYNKGITTMPTEDEARLDETITRAELAKMISVYATEVLGKEKVTNTSPDYNDVDGVEGDLRGFITLSFQLGLMGRTPTGEALPYFNPNGLVTRAEFATVLSRLLFGDEYENPNGDYYTRHLQALEDHGILNNTNPLINELRGWIMLMLMRGE